MAHLAGSPITFAAFLQKPCARRPTEPQKFAGPIWPKPTARPARPDPAPRRGLSATRQHPQDAATPAPCHGRHPSRRSIPVDLWLLYWLLVVALACLPARTHQPMLPYATKSSRRNGCFAPPILAIHISLIPSRKRTHDASGCPIAGSICPFDV